MIQDESRPRRDGSRTTSATKSLAIVEDTSDIVPLSVAIAETIEDIGRRAEVDAAYDRLAWELGRQQGRREGRAEADAFIQRIRLDREDTADMAPTGENCPCGRPRYTSRRRR